MLEEIDIDTSTLSEYEKSYLDKNGFWDSSKVSQRSDNIVMNRVRKTDPLGVREESVSLESWELFVPGVNAILSEYMDIAQLFSTNYNLGRFLDFMFTYSLNNDIDGLSPFYFHPFKKGGGNYVFDYSYVLNMIIEWCVVELEAEREEMMKFMKMFVASSKKSFVKSNHFLIGVLFGSHYQIMGSIFMHPQKIKVNSVVRNAYSNPVIVKSNSGEEFYFLGVPFVSSEIQKYCNPEVVFRLIKERNNLNISQYKWGNEVRYYRTDEVFFRIDFPD